MLAMMPAGKKHLVKVLAEFQLNGKLDEDAILGSLNEHEWCRVKTFDLKNLRQQQEFEKCKTNGTTKFTYRI